MEHRSLALAHDCSLFCSSGIEGVPFTMNPKFDMSVVMNDVSYQNKFLIIVRCVRGNCPLMVGWGEGSCARAVSIIYSAVFGWDSE